jgi:hypothetical protein
MQSQRTSKTCRVVPSSRLFETYVTFMCHPCFAAVTLLQNIPVADAKPEDIQDLLGGALFKALYKWFTESGPVYLLPTGGLLHCCCVTLLLCYLLVVITLHLT